ncbi:MAG: hypothetical protein ACK2VD_27105 [Anaerolineae bacterium]
MIHLPNLRKRWWAIGPAVVLVLIGVVLVACAAARAAPPVDGAKAAQRAETDAGAPGIAAAGDYVVLAWNDLGMHCYNRSFQYLAILPPYNTLWAQVVRIGDPPEIVTTGITLTYEFPDNTYSVGKSNFWDYEQALFGVNLPSNVGLVGKGLSGTLDLSGDHFVAEGIPLTEFRDSDYAANPSNPLPYPYQLATITVRDVPTGTQLAQVTVVAPVSTEMHCDNCHHDGGVEGIATGSVELNILTLHDQENADEYPSQYSSPLVDQAPVLCANCHSTNALGMPGVAGLPSLSSAMHGKHAEEGVGSTQADCYQCHPGPQTQCLRGTMSQNFGLTCSNCHTGLSALASSSRQPWIDEPKCGQAGCHQGIAFDYPESLYRHATGHGAVYCEACHDSPHAIAPSREANDAIKFVEWQGHNGPLSECTACHATMPDGPGPHEFGPLSPRSYLPITLRDQ